VDVFEVLIILFFGLTTGVVFTGTSWKTQVKNRDAQISDLEASIEEKDVEVRRLHLAQEILKEQYGEINSLNSHIEDNKRDHLILSQQINEKVTELETDFKTRLEKKENNIQRMKDQIKEKDESIEVLKTNLANMEEINQESVHLTEQLAGNLTDVKGQLGVREQEIRSLSEKVTEKDESIDQLKENVTNLEELNTESANIAEQLKSKLEDIKVQLDNREQNIVTLNELVNEKTESLDLLKFKIEKLEEQNHESAQMGEHLTAMVEELESSVEEKVREISLMDARMGRMQDDLTIIGGIGPKVSSVLRGTGIKSFKKLGALDVESITEILESENPNLLRLVDPEMWPEQARLAFEEDWDALTVLQESLKDGKRNRQEVVYATPM
jgi:chromosome segregation ATPase